MIKKAVFIALGALVCITAIFIYNVDRKLDNMELDTDNIIADESHLFKPDTAPIEPLTLPDQQSNLETEDFYTLLIGLDQREKQLMLNTDSLIVAHIIPQNATVKLISIPRDQKVTNAKGDSAKINAIFASGYQSAVKAARKDPDLLSGKMVSIGDIKIHEEYISSGVAALRKSVEQHLSVPITYSFLIHFNTVVELVDEVGGIEINVDKSMRYTAKFDGTSIHLDKGLQTLNGRDALNYSRHRLDDRGTAYESSDFDRGRRQQEVIAALVKKITGWGSVTKAMGLLDIVTSNIKTDMKRSKMAALITDFYGDLNSESIVSIPYPGEWVYPYVIVEEDQFKVMIDQFKSTERTSASPSATS